MQPLLDALRSVAEPTRLRLLALVAQGEATVSELCEIVGQSQSRVSRHLRILADAGVITRYREGHWVFHRLGDAHPARALADQTLALLPPDDAVLQRDAERLQAVRDRRVADASAYFAAMADEWGAVRSLHVDEREVEAAIVEALAGRPIGRLLDIGTGTGRMLELLGPGATTALGVDLSHDMLRVARATLIRLGQPQLQARHADMYHLDLPAASFDTVVVHQVLHYADRPADVIAQAARVLCPGGRMLVVDFAPHEVEALRTTHRHRRLGFAEQELLQWSAAHGLRGAVVRRLHGTPLTVLVWRLEKPRVASDTTPPPSIPVPEHQHA